VDRLARETLRDYHKERSIRAREELVAELGASYLMADLGLAYTPRPDHAAYLASWLGALRHDPKAIFNAAAQAQAAADWIHAAHKAAARRWRWLHEARWPRLLWPDGAQAACRSMSAFRPLTGFTYSIWWQRSAPTWAGYAILRSHPPLAGRASRAAAQSLCRHRPDLPRRPSRRLDR
jgi:hypothetical protein